MMPFETEVRETRRSAVSFINCHVITFPDLSSVSFKHGLSVSKVYASLKRELQKSLFKDMILRLEFSN